MGAVSDQLAAISYDGATIAFSQAEGADGLPIGEILRQVGKTGKPSAQPLAGSRASFLAAARPVPLGRGASDAVLLLAKRIDDALLSAVAGRSGRTMLVSDGRRALAQSGTGSARLEALVGQEASADVALSDPAEHGAALAIAPGFWLWSLGRTDFGQAAAAFDRTRRQASWAVAIPLALVLLALALRRGRRQSADVPAPREPVLSQNLTRLGLSASGAPSPPSAGPEAARRQPRCPRCQRDRE